MEHNASPVQPYFDGIRLRALRKRRGLSVEELAQRAGLTRRHIWRLEAGKRPRVAAVTLARIALALDTSVDYLVHLSDQADVPHGEEVTPRFDGKRMRALRKQRGLSVAKLARAAGITPRHVWRLEAEQRPRVAAVTVARLAQALGTGVDYLMHLSDQP